MKAVVNQQYGSPQKDVKHGLFLKYMLHTLATGTFLFLSLFFFENCIEKVLKLWGLEAGASSTFQLE